MLIINGTVLIIDDKDEGFGAFDVRVDVNYISEVEPFLETIGDESIIDASGKLILPDLTHAHYHTYSNVFKSTMRGKPLEIWTPETTNCVNFGEEYERQTGMEIHS